MYFLLQIKTVWCLILFGIEDNIKTENVVTIQIQNRKKKKKKKKKEKELRILIYLGSEPGGSCNYTYDSMYSD